MSCFPDTSLLPWARSISPCCLPRCSLSNQRETQLWGLSPPVNVSNDGRIIVRLRVMGSPMRRIYIARQVCSIWPTVTRCGHGLRGLETLSSVLCSTASSVDFYLLHSCATLTLELTSCSPFRCYSSSNVDVVCLVWAVSATHYGLVTKLSQDDNK